MLLLLMLMCSFMWLHHMKPYSNSSISDNSTANGPDLMKQSKKTQYHETIGSRHVRLHISISSRNNDGHNSNSSNNKNSSSSNKSSNSSSSSSNNNNNKSSNSSVAVTTTPSHVPCSPVSTHSAPHLTSSIDQRPYSIEALKPMQRLHPCIIVARDRACPRDAHQQCPPHSKQQRPRRPGHAVCDHSICPGYRLHTTTLFCAAAHMFSSNRLSLVCLHSICV
jgi:hypothetical protein